MLQQLIQDLFFARRLMWRQPAFSLLAILTLALGIGASTTIYSVVDCVLLRPLPYADAERLMQVGTDLPQFNRIGSMGYLPFLELQEHARTVEAMTLLRSDGINMTGRGEARRLQVVGVTSGYQGVVGRAPMLGRGFDAEIDALGGPRLALLSHGFWQREFGGEPAALGSTFTLNEGVFTVVGVMPPDHRPLEALSGAEVDLWIPIVHFPRPPQDFTSWGRPRFSLVARRNADATMEQVRQEFLSLRNGLNEAHPEEFMFRGELLDIAVAPLRDLTLGGNGNTLVMFLAAVGTLLLLALVNVSNLLLSRATDRRRELAVRTALGASRARLIRQGLAESTALALLGGGLGVAMAYFGANMIANLQVLDLPRLAEVSVDGRILGVALGLSITTGVLIGLIPAFSGSRVRPGGMLKEGDPHMSAGRRSLRLQNAFMVTQTSLALVLLLGAGLLINSFIRLHQVDPGFRSEDVSVMELQFALETGGRIGPKTYELLERLESTPGIQSAAASYTMPVQSSSKGGVSIFIAGDDASSSAEMHAVSPGFFDTLGAGGVAAGGRDFGTTDVDPGIGAVIVNEAFVREYLDGDEPLGLEIQIRSQQASPLSIVGVVPNLRHHGLDAPAPPSIYIPYQGQWLGPATYVFVRSSLDLSALAPALRDAVVTVEPTLPVVSIVSLERALQDTIVTPRLYSLLFIAFAAAALLLATIGIFATVSFAVSRQRTEFGIRLALGAGRMDLIRLVLVRRLGLVALGLGLGLIVAVAASRSLADLVFGITPTDAPTYIATAALLLVVTGVACFIPTIRATRIDPMSALRCE